MKKPRVKHQKQPEDQKSNITLQELVLTTIDWVQEILKFLPARTVITNYSQVNRTFYKAYKELINTPAKKDAFIKRLTTEEEEKIQTCMQELRYLIPDSGDATTRLFIETEFDPTDVPNLQRIPHDLTNPENVDFAQNVLAEIIDGTQFSERNSCSIYVTIFSFFIGGALALSGKTGGYAKSR